MPKEHKRVGFILTDERNLILAHVQEDDDLNVYKLEEWRSVVFLK
jgi:hypothetical protein